MTSRLIRRLRAGWSLLRVRELRAKPGRCPFCDLTVFVRLNSDDNGVRCVRCAASVIHLAMGWALRDQVSDLSQRDACEFSARGPLSRWLQRTAKSLSCSEYFADAAPGTLCQGVRCEDMQQLSYSDQSFDLLTHSEVLEHVPDDAAALRETYRVLRNGGVMLFSVPVYDGDLTVERARLDGAGGVQHLQPPVYHLDPLRAEGILAFRDYGRDILARVSSAGYRDVKFLEADRRIPWIEPRCVIIACVDRAASL